MEGRISLADVGACAGVSVATASRALNPASLHPVNGATRRRVEEAAAKLGFRPNGLARSFQFGRSQTIGVLVHDVRDAYFNEFARGASDAAEVAGYLTVICNTDRDPDRELRYVQMLVDNRAAGILFVGGGLEDRAYQRRLGPCLAEMPSYGGVAVALGPRAGRLPAELPDNQGGARLATEHLLGLGHRRIGLIDGPPRLRTSAERRRGYEEALSAAGVVADPAWVVPGDYTVETGAVAIARLVEAGSGVTGVFVSNDAMAIGAINECRRRGWRVPEDLSLVGFDDMPLASLVDPPLTTVSVPMAKIGAAGVERILALLAGEQRGSARTVHPVGLVVRASTAPPRGRR